MLREQTNGDALARWAEELRDASCDQLSVGALTGILARAGVANGGRCLDVGCGDGWLADKMAHRGYIIDGIDASSQMIKLATGRAATQASFYKANVVEWAGAYDAAWSWGHSLGYYGVDALRDELRHFRQLLLAHAPLILDFRNAAFVSHAIKTKGGIYSEHSTSEVRISERTDGKIWDVYITIDGNEGSRPTAAQFHVVLPSKDFIQVALPDFSFGFYGDYKLRPFSVDDSERMVAIGVRRS